MRSTTWSTAFSMPRLRPSGFAPAATFFRPSRTIVLGQHGRGGGAVARDVVGGGGHLAYELGALVCERILDLDLTSDGNAVVGDRRGAELLVDHDVAALGAERDLHGVRDGVDAVLERACAPPTSYFSSL